MTMRLLNTNSPSEKKASPPKDLLPTLSWRRRQMKTFGWHLKQSTSFRVNCLKNPPTPNLALNKVLAANRSIKNKNKNRQPLQSLLCTNVGQKTPHNLKTKTKSGMKLKCTQSTRFLTRGPKDTRRTITASTRAAAWQLTRNWTSLYTCGFTADPSLTNATSALSLSRSRAPSIATKGLNIATSGSGSSER